MKMSKKDPNQIAAIEKAIAEKYGKDTIRNPRSSWNEEKEKEYLVQMREHYRKHNLHAEHAEKIDINGIKVSQKLLSRESLKYCLVCGAAPHSTKDDVCLIKFECCNKCYIQYVEHREERWQKGWRPHEINQNET